MTSGTDPAAVQARTVRVLAASQVLGGIGVASGIAVAGLIAQQVSGSTTMSGLASTAMVFGAALTALPLSRITTATGRRAGLCVGWATGGFGAALSVVAAVLSALPLLLVGVVLVGGAAAAGLQSRYAATDLAPATARARALSIVVWATTVGAVLGPNLSGPAGSLALLLGIPPLAGPLVVAAAAFAAGTAVVGLLLRPDPLLTARRLLGADGQPPPAPHLRTSLRVIRGTSAGLLGVTSVACAHAVMVAVMSMTPVHMHDAGAQLRVVGLVISVHIAGMYALSPVVGWLADRAGRVAVILLGQLLLLAAGALAGGLSHNTTALGVALFLLGVGWSCALVAGSTLLSESVSLTERPGAQGAADFLMNLCGGAAGAVSGLVLDVGGYRGLTVGALALVLPVVFLALLRRTPAMQSIT